MKLKTFIFVLIPLFSIIFFQYDSQAEWISFIGSSGSSEEAQLDVDWQINDHGIDIEFTTYGANQSPISGTTQSYTLISIPGCSFIEEPGYPKLPMWSKFISIPDGATLSVSVVYSESYTPAEKYYIVPAYYAMPDLITSDDNSQYEAPPNNDIYGRKNAFPKNIFRLENEVIIRGSRLQLLRVFPIRYHPLNGDIEAFHNIELKIIYNFAGNEKKRNKLYRDKRFQHETFDNILNRLCLNYTENKSYSKRSSTKVAFEEGNAFWIITDSIFLEAAQALKKWKIQKGISTIIKTTEQIGKTFDEIKNDISIAYQTENPPPTYILIIGDAEYIPVAYKTTHHYIYNNYPQGRIGTDLYYTTVDGDDYYPDISIGRLSVDTPEQAMKRVLGIVEYEKNPPANANFYQNLSLCAYFQDEDSNSYADRRFVQTSEDIATFLSEKTFSIHRIYSKKSYVQPKFWSKNISNFTGPSGSPGDNIEGYFQNMENFSWDGNHDHITNAIHDGQFLIVHRDHGSSSGWGDPAYHVEDVFKLKNGNSLPVVWSINCMTGWFDNETDDPATNTPEQDIHFSEAWERNPNGGAIGVIASTRISYSWYNDRLVWGLMDAIWPGFTRDDTFSKASLDIMSEMGPALNYAKFYMATQFTNDYMVKMTFEMFHWFGDPTMQIRTSQPKSIDAIADNIIFPDTAELDIHIEQPDLQICMSQGDQIISRHISTAGKNIFTFPDSLNKDAPIHVCITGHNYSAYETNIFFVTDYCNPPDTGNWIISKHCILKESFQAPANVIVEDNSILIIPKDITLDIDLHNYNINVLKGSGVLIKSGGNIR